MAGRKSKYNEEIVRDFNERGIPALMDKDDRTGKYRVKYECVAQLLWAYSGGGLTDEECCLYASLGKTQFGSPISHRRLRESFFGDAIEELPARGVNYRRAWLASIRRAEQMIEARV